MVGKLSSSPLPVTGVKGGDIRTGKGKKVEIIIFSYKFANMIEVKEVG